MNDLCIVIVQLISELYIFLLISFSDYVRYCQYPQIYPDTGKYMSVWHRINMFNTDKNKIMVVLKVSTYIKTRITSHPFVILYAISLHVIWYYCLYLSESYRTSWNIIHLLHAGEGNMKNYSPKSIIFPEGNTRGENDTCGWINFHISCTRMLWMFYYSKWNQENRYM